MMSTLYTVAQPVPSTVYTNVQTSATSINTLVLLKQMPQVKKRGFPNK